MTPPPPAQFAHLRVSSVFSMKYAVCGVEGIVRAAADHGHPVVGLVDRDGVAGVVRFLRACRDTGVEAVVGVDLAVEPVCQPSHRTARPRATGTPAVTDGGDAGDVLPRVVVLALGARGWAALCRLVTKAHTRPGDTGSAPAVSVADICEEAAGGGVAILLGQASEVAHHIMRRRGDLAHAALRPWRQVPRGSLFIEVVTHGVEPASTPVLGRPDYSTRAARMLLGFADDAGVPAVLSNAVRYLRREDAPVADVLDAVRRLEVMSQAAATTGQAFYASSAQMRARAHLICEGSGTTVDTLIGRTVELAMRCRVSAADIGMGVPRPPEVFGPDAHTELMRRCWHRFDGYAAGISRMQPDYGVPKPGLAQARERLQQELGTIEGLGFAGYFLTVASIVDLIKERGIRVSARGSGAGSLVNHLLGISAVDPLQHGLLMERFLSPLRTGLPDIDIDVESARRLEVYDLIFERFSGARTACVSMTDTYRVRQAIRDAGRALGLPSGEVAACASAFPHIRARDMRAALRDLPELRNSSISRLFGQPRWQMLIECVERLDGLPRHRAMHPCGIILSDDVLLDRTPVEPSRQGYQMSQFDKDDVEDMGFLKLDVLGVRMQSAMAHAVAEVARVGGGAIDLEQVPRDDPETFDLISSTRTLGCFQIESPGQRELIGKFSPASMGDLIIDISLFRPGPVKSDMVTPFLQARQGDRLPDYIHPSLRPVLAQTHGVVVFHEQVIRIIAVMTGCSLAHADEVRRGLGSIAGQDGSREWFYRGAQARGYPLDVIERVWEVLRAFASFGFCKAHAAAFAVPTYQSAWLKRHHPAAFFAGVLTHDPGMYPKRLIVSDARAFDVPVLPVDINASDDVYRVQPGAQGGWAVRLPLTAVAGISDAEVVSTIANRPYRDVVDVLYRSGLSRPSLESLIEVGACDSMQQHGLEVAGTETDGTTQRATRRDLLLEVARHKPSRRARNQVRAVREGTLFADAASLSAPRFHGLPEMTAREQVGAEMSVLSMDVSAHIVSFHAPFLAAVKATRSPHLLRCRSQQEVLVAGVKVAVQTPPVRSGRRVVFLTLDDGAGPVDLTFFEDAQRDYASTVFGSWLLLVRGHVRRTGARGLSIRATGCWDLMQMERVWRDGGVAAVRSAMLSAAGGAADSTPDDGPDGSSGVAGVIAAVDDAAAGLAQSRSVRPVLVHPSGFRQSPYADVRPSGSHPSAQRYDGLGSL
ncbi:MAG: DNA polymerase III subunit alpha [Actinomycetales bacterium]|nr:DNA polymerase III subunit alpha [Actinomycetales bacterium]